LIQVRTDFGKKKVFKADSGDLNQFGEVRTDLDKLKQYNFKTPGMLNSLEIMCLKQKSII
jgi:hypothetical protein